MTLETYMGIALVVMALDAEATYYAHVPYNWKASLFLAAVWPLTAAVMIFCVIIYRQVTTTGEQQ